MDINWVVVIYTMLLIDSMGAIVMSWFGQKWWMNATGSFAKYFPAAKGWAVLYFMLVLVIGYLLGLL